MLAWLPLVLLTACGSPPPPEPAAAPTPAPSAPTAAEAPTAKPAKAAGDDGLVNGMTAPDFTLPVVGTRDTWHLNDHVAPDGNGASKGAIVAFMASWCGYCRASLPTVKEIVDANPDLTVVVLTIDDTDATRLQERKHLDDAGLTVPLLAADEDTRRAWLGVGRRIPRFFFLNAVAEVMVQDRGFGEKVEPMMPKQAKYVLEHPTYTPR